LLAALAKHLIFNNAEGSLGTENRNTAAQIAAIIFKTDFCLFCDIWRQRGSGIEYGQIIGRRRCGIALGQPLNVVGINR